MQTTGHIFDWQTKEKIKVLLRRGRKWDKFNYEMLLKIRKSGKDGCHLTDEENYLNGDYEKLEKLKEGETVGC